MRNVFAAALFAATISLPLVAQDYPKGEAFGGYQYLRWGGGNPAVNANGWNASVAGNVNEVVGVAADFSGAYKTLNGVSVDTYTYTFGPVISLNHEGKVNPFVHALFGGTHIGASLAGFGSSSVNGFAMLYGGGAHVKLNRNFALPGVQAERVYYHCSGKSFKNKLGILTGILFGL